MCVCVCVCVCGLVAGEVVHVCLSLGVSQCLPQKQELHQGCTADSYSNLSHGNLQAETPASAQSHRF